MPNSVLISNFEVTTFAFLFVLLMISMISVISTVSSLASKHFCSFAHCPYHTMMANAVHCYPNTCHPHHFKLQKYVFLTLFFCAWMVVSPPPPPLGHLAPWNAPPLHQKDDEGAHHLPL